MWKELLVVVTLNVKMVWGEWGYGPENRTTNILIWFHLMFSFAQNEWTNLDVP